MDINVDLKPMASAPRPSGEDNFEILVLDEWTDSGIVERGWKLVYWLDAFDGRCAGWYGQHCGDLRHPVGWVLATNSLPKA